MCAQINSPQGKSHSSSTEKITVGIFLNRNLVGKVRIRKLNISRISEQALNSILEHLESQNHLRTSDVLDSRFFLKDRWWAGPDLNRGPSACQADVLTKLDDRPIKLFVYCGCIDQIKVLAYVSRS